MENLMRRIGFLVLISALLTSLSPNHSIASDQWPMYQANAAHTGYLPVTLDPASFALRWKKSFSSLPLNPVTAAQGLVFVSESGYFDNNQYLYVLDADSGDIKWSINYPRTYSVNPPSFYSGNVYIQTAKDLNGNQPYLRAYDAMTGTLIFRGSFSAQWERYYSPTIYGGKVYVDGGSFGGMYAFDATSGVQDWFYSLPQCDQWTPAIDGKYAYTYVGQYKPGLYVVDRQTGKLIYSILDTNFKSNGWSMNLAPVLGGENDAFGINNGRLIKFDLTSHTIGWQKTASFSGQPTVANGVIYAISSGALGAYNQNTGVQLWAWEPPSGSLKETIIATDSHLFVRTDNVTYCISLTDHLQKWSYQAGGHLSLGESTLYIAGQDGSLNAISLGLADLFVPEKVNFSSQIGTPQTKTIQMLNVGDETLQISDISSSCDEFTVTSPALPLSIDPHSSEQIDITFTPAAQGSKSGILVVTSDDPNEPKASISLSGYGLGQQELSVADKVDFNSFVGKPQSKTLALSNDGDVNLQISGFLTSSGRFSVTSATLPFVISPQATAHITVTFTPDALGTVADTLLITSDDPNKPTTSVILAGYGSSKLQYSFYSPAVNLLLLSDELILGKWSVVGTEDLRTSSYSFRTFSDSDIYIFQDDNSFYTESTPSITGTWTSNGNLYSVDVIQSLPARLKSLFASRGVPISSLSIYSHSFNCTLKSNTTMEVSILVDGEVILSPPYWSHQGFRLNAKYTGTKQQ